MIYYIADTHFGHENVMKFDNRPFASADEMDQTIINNWNAIVNERDDVYILGDFAYRSGKPYSWYLQQLKGCKHLIVGNHDSKLLKDTVAMEYFVSVDTMAKIVDNSQSVILCHYPIIEWDGYFRNSYHVYGHIHNAKNRAYEVMAEEERALNAGCMINQYMPVTLDQLIVNNMIFKSDSASVSRGE